MSSGGRAVGVAWRCERGRGVLAGPSHVPSLPCFFANTHAHFLSGAAAWLLQPSRGGALERFVERAHAWGAGEEEEGGGNVVGWEVAEECVPLGLGQDVGQGEEGPLRLLRAVRRHQQGGGGGSGSGSSTSEVK